MTEERENFSRRKAFMLAGVTAAAGMAMVKEADANTVFTSYAFPATGAPTSRTMPDRLAEIFNVKDFGALGNSTNFLDGADDRAAIQLAVDNCGAYNAVYASGGTVFFPAGLYRVGGPINLISGHQVTLLGTSFGATGIGGYFPDYIFNNPLSVYSGIDGNGFAFGPGPGVGSISYFTISNSYLNHLTSCSYTGASGTATCASGTVSGTTLTIGGAITGTFGIGQRLFGSGLQTNTIIAKVLSGAGAAGSTYQINLPCTISVGVAITAYEGGIVTFGVKDSIVSASHTIQIGDYFHVFGCYPRPYNSRYVACTGTTGTTLVGGGGIPATTNNPTAGDPGTPTMLGAVGGGGIRSDSSTHSFIEKCNIGAFNAMHLGGGTGYGILFNGAYNAFGISVRDVGMTQASGHNGEYGTVAAYCGEVDFSNCSVFSYDKGIVASSNGFGFNYGQIETNNTGIVLGLDDQGFLATSGASVIMANHTEDVDIAVDIVHANNHLQASNQWTSTQAARGDHNGFLTTGTTVSGTAAINTIAAVVITGNTTIHSPRITSISSLVGVKEGMAISGTGIPSGSTVLTIDGSDSLTFINTAGGTGLYINGEPLGASATGTTISITLTIAFGMIVSNNGPLGGTGTAIAPGSGVLSVGAVSGGNYDIVLNNKTTASETASYQFFVGCISNIRISGLSKGTFLGNSCDGPNMYPCIDTSGSNCTQTVFIGNGAGSNGVGSAWSVPAYPASPSAAGITYVGNNNPDMSFAFQSLPGQPAQSLGHAAMAGNMEYSITDCSTSTFLAVAGPSGTGLAANRKVRSTPRLSCTITRSGGTATVTTAANHGLTGTQILTITGADQSDYNGSFSCNCGVAVNQFSYTVANSPATPATGTITFGYWFVVG